MNADQIRAAIEALQALLNEPAKPAVGPNEVYLAVTGHVLPKPLPETGEMFIGYCQRVAATMGQSAGAVGSLFNGTGHLGDVSDPENWPLMADKFFFGWSYMTEADRVAYEKERAKWRAWGPTPPPG